MLTGRNFWNLFKEKGNQSSYLKFLFLPSSYFYAQFSHLLFHISQSPQNEHGPSVYCTPVHPTPLDHTPFLSIHLEKKNYFSITAFYPKLQFHIPNCPLDTLSLGFTAPQIRQKFLVMLSSVSISLLDPHFPM